MVTNVSNDSPEAASPNTLDSLKLHADWCKWLATLETAVIAGGFAFVTNRSLRPSDTTIDIVLIAVLLLIVSLWGACQFLFSMPRVLLRIHEIRGQNVLDEKGENFRFPLRRYLWFQAAFLYLAALVMVLGAICWRLGYLA